MDQVIEFFVKLFDVSDWPPRWHCGKWSDFHGWFFIVSDLLVWSAYFCIPLLILRFISKRKDARFHRIYFLFAAFILACGSTHFLDAIMFWFPAYRLNALMKFITGVISWITVFNLVRILPKAFSLKSAEELEGEVEQRKKAESALLEKNRQLTEAQSLAKLGHWEIDVRTNKLTWSNSLYQIYGIEAGVELTVDMVLDRAVEEDREFARKNFTQAIETGQFPENYVRVNMADGTINTLYTKGQVIRGADGTITRLLGTSQDVTELKKSEVELMLKSKHLEATNAELQKFAYVASHDLQEPLRKIITFSFLLEKETEGNLSEKSKSYLSKMVNASQRMQVLINDILDFSQISAEVGTFGRVSLNRVVEQVRTDLEILIGETGAKIEVDNLPEIEGIESQMGQLFQNLISNSLKFRKPDIKPVVQIYAEKTIGGINSVQGNSAYSILANPTFWQNQAFCNIYVKDNGIGFDAVYADRIFNLFQRLHSRTSFDGTGIGLAICRKIVDNHHGEIQAKSEVGQGATFIITLPISQRTYGFKKQQSPENLTG